MRATPENEIPPAPPGDHYFESRTPGGLSYAKIIETRKVANWNLRRITIMDDSRDFKKEYDAFLKKVPY